VGARRRAADLLFSAFCVLSVILAFLFLALFLFSLLRDAWGWLDWQFLTSFPSRSPERAGVKAALGGTLWLALLLLPLSVPLGVAAAVYLEEYARGSRWDRLVYLNIANLSGVPSIIYGMLGLTFFVRGLGLGRVILSGALILSLLVLPLIILSSREALRAVPNELRLAGLALGATRWQVIRSIVLPAALPGILTGVILAFSRALGETAPLIMVGALTFVAFLPLSPFDPFTALPVQIFNWASRPQEEFLHLAAAGSIVLLGIVGVLNAVASFLRARYHLGGR